MESANEKMKGLEFHPVDMEHWDDLAAFFESQDNAHGCWCMYWRLTSADFKKLTVEERRARLMALVQANIPVGVLAYRQGTPIGWCSVGPRETYAHLEHSSILVRLDDRQVWSVACFVIDPKFQGLRLPTKLLQAGVAYAVSQGATIVEGYPAGADDMYRFMGSQAAFAEAGFHEAGEAKNGRKIVRYFAEPLK
jgi:GNAT superfamily N-acetyltransferase